MLIRIARDRTAEQVEKVITRENATLESVGVIPLISRCQVRNHHRFAPSGPCCGIAAEAFEILLIHSRTLASEGTLPNTQASRYFFTLTPRYRSRIDSATQPLIFTI